MYPYEDEPLSIYADSITDVSHGIVYVLSAGIMLIPLVMLIALLYSGIRERRLRSTNQAAAPTQSGSDATPDRSDWPRTGRTL